MARVAFVTAAGRPVAFQAKGRRNPAPVLRLSPPLQRARDALLAAEAAHKATPTMGTALRVDKARQTFANMIARRGRRNPSVRQRLRSSQKHLVAKKGADPRLRPDARALVAAAKKSPGGLLRRHRLKEARKRGAVRGLAGRLY